MRGLLIACAKRPISPEQIDSLVDSIEFDLRTSPKSEVVSKTLGDMVMSRLAKLDEVAYVRFASVYKHFNNVEIDAKNSAASTTGMSRMSATDLPLYRISRVSRL